MDKSSLSWEEKVCCYFIREICDWLNLGILRDLRNECFVVRNYRAELPASEYLGEESGGTRIEFHNLLEIYEAINLKGYTNEITEYINEQSYGEGDAILQWCKLANQFLESRFVPIMLKNITYWKLYGLGPTRGMFNIVNVQELLRGFTIRDKRYLYVG